MSPENREKAAILIVDDHPIVRDGLAELISSQPDLEVCGKAENAEQAMALIEQTPPNVAIVDLSLEGTSGLELIKNIRAVHDSLLILVLSMHDEALYAERVLRAGARGYIMKQEATEKLLMAVRKVLQGGIYLSERMSAKMLEGFISGRPDTSGSPVERLSDRELEVLDLIGRGHASREIAERLHLSPKTVDTYRARIREKLDISDRAELIRYAIEWVKAQT